MARFGEPKDSADPRPYHIPGGDGRAGAWASPCAASLRTRSLPAKSTTSPDGASGGFGVDPRRPDSQGRLLTEALERNEDGEAAPAFPGAARKTRSGI